MNESWMNESGMNEWMIERMNQSIQSHRKKNSKSYTDLTIQHICTSYI